MGMKRVLVLIVGLFASGCGENNRNADIPAQPVEPRPFNFWNDFYQRHDNDPHYINWYSRDTMYLRPGTDSLSRLYVDGDGNYMLRDSPIDSILLAQRGLNYILSDSFECDLVIQCTYWPCWTNPVFYEVSKLPNSKYQLTAAVFTGSSGWMGIEYEITDSGVVFTCRDGTKSHYPEHRLIKQYVQRRISFAEFEHLRNLTFRNGVLEYGTTITTRRNICFDGDHAEIAANERGVRYYRTGGSCVPEPRFLQAICFADSLSGLNALPPYVHTAANPCR